MRAIGTEASRCAGANRWRGNRSARRG